jgi:histidinol-phosphate/aromatic aminotransferase/cobyric acid decarboxylase-like protein
VRCDPDQVIVTAGAQQGLGLLARLLLDPGDTVLMEDQGYPGPVSALKVGGARVVSIQVDDQGIKIAMVPAPGRDKGSGANSANPEPSQTLASIKSQVLAHFRVFKLED